MRTRCSSAPRSTGRVVLATGCGGGATGGPTTGPPPAAGPAISYVLSDDPVVGHPARGVVPVRADRRAQRVRRPVRHRSFRGRCGAGAGPLVEGVRRPEDVHVPAAQGRHVHRRRAGHGRHVRPRLGDRLLHRRPRGTAAAADRRRRALRARRRRDVAARRAGAGARPAVGDPVRAVRRPAGGVLEPGHVRLSARPGGHPGGARRVRADPGRLRLVPDRELGARLQHQPGAHHGRGEGRRRRPDDPARLGRRPRGRQRVPGRPVRRDPASGLAAEGDDVRSAAVPPAGDPAAGGADGPAGPAPGRAPACRSGRRSRTPTTRSAPRRRPAAARPRTA